MDLRFHHSGSTLSEESALDMETPPLESFATTSAGQLSETNAAYFSWPTCCRLNDAAEDRANYFDNLLKGVLPERIGQLPTGERAVTLLELMTIRAFHSKILKQVSLATAIGFRIRRGLLTDIPAILVFVARKVHRQWLSHIQCLPCALEGPGGVWCDVDVVEFSYYGAPAATLKEEFYTELVDGLRGSFPCIGSGSQVASQSKCGTIGAIVKSRTGNRQVGFLTNRHVAVDLDYPNQKMFHPMPPSLGPGVYLGAVERATSFITDDLWYGIFAGTNPGSGSGKPQKYEKVRNNLVVVHLDETFVRADGAFIPFAEDFDILDVTMSVTGIGEIGDVKVIDLQSPVNSVIGQQVTKVGRSSGLTTGTIMAYALEYNNEKGICFLTDFLVVGENQQTFDLEGDSGSLILLTGQDGEKPRPIGIIWGGTANRGRLKLKAGQPPENWTSGVDLGRLLDVLELDLITTNESLQVALREQKNASVAAAGVETAIGESSSRGCIPSAENHRSLDLNVQNSPLLEPKFVHEEVHVEGGTSHTVEHQFISSFPSHEIWDSQSQPPLRDGFEGISISLQLGEPEPKRRKHSGDSLPDENAK